jgi:hypothetical protein
MAGQAFLQTVGHFFPQMNTWLDQLPDSRTPQLCYYPTRFLAWWGVCLYLFQLGSRRQLDFQLSAVGTRLLDNLNRLAQTECDRRPVHDTLDHFLEHCPAEAWVVLRTRMIQRLLRMKVLDDARLQGGLVLLVDGTGLLNWRRRHCPQCLVRKHQNATYYQHQVLEAKLLGPAGLVLSIGSEFIENTDLPDPQGPNPTTEKIKQDCELRAFSRLAPKLKQAFPQLRLVLAGDSLFACGRVFELAAQYNWDYVVTFKEGHLPSVWGQFQAALSLYPQNHREHTTAAGFRQGYRWVCGLSYDDGQGRRHVFNALECIEETPNDVRHFAWLTVLPVDAANVMDIANKGGRARWTLENEGFNRQKNSGLNLEHVYSTDPKKWKAYYYLLQIAFILVQLIERGSLLRRLSKTRGGSVSKVFGSLKNIAQRLLESILYFHWTAAWFDPHEAARIHIGFDSS